MEDLSSIRVSVQEALDGNKLSTFRRKVCLSFMKLDDATCLSGTCSMCDDSIKVHRHSLMFEQVRTILYLYRKVGILKEFVLSEVIRGRNNQDNFQKLRYFGLIQKKIDGKDGKTMWSTTDSTSKKGIWRLTQKAEDFILGRITIPESVQTYRGDVLLRSAERISIGSKLSGWLDKKVYAARAEKLQKVLCKIVDSLKPGAEK